MDRPGGRINSPTDGRNYWPYGVEANRKTLEAILLYSHEQGLAKRKLKIEDLFHASTLELMEGPA